MAKARWYDSWISASRRETASLASLSPTHVTSIHQRQESETAVNFEDGQEQNHTVASTKKRTRYAPRRLSLVERFDLASSSPPMPLPIPTSVSATASVPVPEPHPTDPPPANVPVLSPIVQEESLLSHREEIDNRVKSWRASATFETNLLASTGQVSLDPANMPNTLPLVYPVAEDDEIRSEMNPEDYSWSITSAGPPSAPDSPTSSPSCRVPSVHMDRRAIGSVPLTPETCTSWGPEDYDPLSPVPLEFRLPSPDLGQRVLEHCPMTPTTATSWGPPSEYPPSPDPESQWIHRYRTPSLDLGQRAGWSRPVTPSTATSWGPPSEYPPSPLLESQWTHYRPPSVDLGRRAEGSRPTTPSTATSWGPPEEWPPTPTTLSRVSTPDAAQQRFSFTEEIGSPASRSVVTAPTSPSPWNLVWPYLIPNEQTTKPRELTPWNFVWPHLTLDKHELKSQAPAPWKYVWPYLVPNGEVMGPRELAPWNYVWPYLTQINSLSGPLESQETFIAVERVAYPVFKICRWLPTLSYSLVAHDSNLCVDPAVYPHFDIYPSVQGDRTDRSYVSSTVPEPTPSLLVLNKGSSLKADRIGYPALKICTYFIPLAIRLHSSAVVPI